MGYFRGDYIKHAREGSRCRQRSFAHPAAMVIDRAHREQESRFIVRAVGWRAGVAASVCWFLCAAASDGEPEFSWSKLSSGAEASVADRGSRGATSDR